ncbi:MAG: hypothetical protein LBF83_03900 [Spirochaetaceae bacterium]|jgi:hypothetical protein|nr:hypothetical protein [Spirochaetaceae bacterium]
MSYIPGKKADFLDRSANPIPVSKGNADMRAFAARNPLNLTFGGAAGQAGVLSGTAKKRPESGIFPAVIP